MRRIVATIVALGITGTLAFVAGGHTAAPVTPSPPPATAPPTLIYCVGSPSDRALGTQAALALNDPDPEVQEAAFDTLTSLRMEIQGGYVRNAEATTVRVAPSPTCTR